MYIGSSSLSHVVSDVGMPTENYKYAATTEYMGSRSYIIGLEAPGHSSLLAPARQAAFARAESRKLFP